MATERKEKLIRVLQIMETTDEKTPLNATQILERLSLEYNLDDIDRRSIYKDIEMLQSCDYPIKKHDNPKMGWYMEHHAFADWEIKFLMDAVRQARCVSVEEAEHIKAQLLKLVSRRSRDSFSNMILPDAGNKDVDYKMGTNVQTMIEALNQRKRIEFQYTEIDEKLERKLRKDGEFYELSLYTLYWSNDNYYLIGAHEKYDDPASYRLDRIQNLKISDLDMIDAKTKFGPNPEKVIREHINKAVDHFGGKAHIIKVDLDPDPVALAILYDFAGKDAHIMKQKNGKLRASFIKAESVTLTAWFLQHLNMFTVVEPAGLRDEIKEALRNGIQVYDTNVD